MHTMTLDQAIEILDITNASTLDHESLKKYVSAAKRKWHPDKVIHQKDQETIQKHTNNFQKIEPAESIVRAYLNGNYHEGAYLNDEPKETPKQPEEVIRENAPSIQDKLQNIWSTVQELGFKHNRRTVELSDGFTLRELLNQDFKQDIAMLAIISLLSYMTTVFLLLIILQFIFPVIASLGFIFSLGMFVSCLLAMLPLSRIWLPQKVLPVIEWFVVLGLKVHDVFVDFHAFFGYKNIGLWIVRGFARFVKYIILWPLYEIAKLIVGNKVVGVIRKDIDYYADVADWYVEDLLQKDPAQMSRQELFDLSHLYSELLEVRKEMA
jgi:hypothetical protein